MGVAAYVFFIIPETKNRTFVEISQMFASKNNFELEGEQLPISKHLGFRMNRYGAMEKTGIEEMYTWSDNE